MSAKKLSPREARLLAELVLCAQIEVPVDVSGDSRRALAALVAHGYVECRYAIAGPCVQAKATREGTYRILNPGKL